MHIPMAYIYSSIYSLCWIDAIVPSLFQVETTKKCLQTLTNIPSGTKSPLVEKHCFKLWQKSKRIPLQSYFSFPLKFTQNSFWKPTFFPFISENVINLWQICDLTSFVWEMNPVDSHLPASSIAHPKLLSPTVCSKGRKSPFLFKRGSFILYSALSCHCDRWAAAYRGGCFLEAWTLSSLCPAAPQLEGPL